jgi:ATP-dependent DNA helicase RecG
MPHQNNIILLCLPTFFCETPHFYIPEATVHCTRFRGTDGRDIIQSEEIQGTLEKQIETSFQIVNSWLTRDHKLLGTKLKGKTLIPEIALREAIINALIHRKYWIPGATKIALFKNRLEIFNPGNFPTATRKLNQLIKMKKIVRVGKGPAVKYHKR